MADLMAIATGSIDYRCGEHGPLGPLGSRMVHLVLGLPPQQARQTLRPQLPAASTIDAENMVRSDSMSLTSPGIWSKLSHQTFPADSHYALRAAKSVRLSPLPEDPTHYQVVISGKLSPSSPECPKYAAKGLKTRQQSRSSTSYLGCPGAKCTDEHPYT
ncbi:hypothetical protein XENOCAPTIV_012143 [Xenoophorus captivus]|uniref:Uncharacterized protein n=1 Tax=Xenoophorus captivus TaxID=1517983 RepID=A0ABV0SA98_9TELE